LKNPRPGAYFDVPFEESVDDDEMLDFNNLLAKIGKKYVLAPQM
jgi:hypothetical protein